MNKPNMVDMDRLSAITVVIDEEIIKRGGTMNKVTDTTFEIFRQGFMG